MFLASMAVGTKTALCLVTGKPHSGAGAGARCYDFAGVWISSSGYCARA